MSGLVVDNFAGGGGVFGTREEAEKAMERMKENDL